MSTRYFLILSTRVNNLQWRLILLFFENIYKKKIILKGDDADKFYILLKGSVTELKPKKLSEINKEVQKI